jgi:protoheme ferro-lyase
MSTLKTVSNKLFKTELANHKIELGLIDDFKKELDFLKQGQKTINASTQEFVNQLNNFSVLQGKLADSFNKSDDYKDQLKADIDTIVALVDKISIQAKELGLDPKAVIGNEVVKIVADVEDTINIIEKNSSDVKKILSI